VVETARNGWYGVAAGVVVGVGFSGLALRLYPASHDRESVLGKS
jgi:hypothetical protein